MPIRIWNTPGGPVRYGEDWTDYIGEGGKDFTEEELSKYGMLRTPRGRIVGAEDEVLDMTSPRNRMAMERVLSRGARMPMFTESEDIETDPLAREASRLATPWRGTETMELEPALADRLGARWSGKASPKPTTLEYESEAMPTAGELEQSAALWKASQRPLATRAGEADIESALAGAERERGLGQLYGAQAEAMGAPKTAAPMTFQEFAAKMVPALRGMSLDQDQLIDLLQTLYEQQYGVAPEETRRGAFGPGGSGTGFEGELDRRYGG